MTFNNSLSPLFALQNHVLDSVWSHTCPAHSLPYFTSSKVLDHNDLTMYSLLFPFRTPLPHRLHPLYMPPLLRLCSPPFSVASQLILIRAVLLAGSSLRNFPSPRPISPLAPHPRPRPSSPSVPYFFLNSRIFHSVVEGSESSFYLNADHSIIILSCFIVVSG